MNVFDGRASLREDAGALIITVLWEEQKYQVEFQPDGAASIVVEDARSGKTVRQGSVPAQSNAPSSRD